MHVKGLLARSHPGRRGIPPGQKNTAFFYLVNSQPREHGNVVKSTILIDADNFIRVIGTDGRGEEVLSEDGVWRSLAWSPDGGRLAAVRTLNDSTIFVFDFNDPESSKAIQLHDPSTQEGIEAEVTVFADALDWDQSGRFLLYDAFNQVPQATGDFLSYWDVNLLDVDNELIIPLFPPLPPGLSIGNPSFAQTNDSFIVFDLIDENEERSEIRSYAIFLS